MRDVILADPSDYGVDLVVGKIFASYQPGTQRWEHLRYPNTRWLTCKTNATVDQPSQTVHVNLLDGDLRVAGQPLGGLPRDVREIFPDVRVCCSFSLTSVPNYRLQQSFFAIPSNLPGMDLMTFPMMSNHKVSTNAAQNDHDSLNTTQVHFSLRGDELVVRAQCNRTNDILALIPRPALLEDLPQTLVHGHVHWLNLSTQIIEIRPVERLWEQSSESWRIDCSSGQYRMYRGRETLVDIRSPTWAMVSECFECLNDVNKRRFDPDSHDLDILISTTPIDSVQSASMHRLNVTLPSYDLSFFVNEREELESRDFKDMVYDEDQSVGALFSLKNLLVLRPKTHIAGTLVPEALIPRCVLIPNGFPETRGNHEVQIDCLPEPNDDAALYHTYEVDTELGCLIGNGSSTSMRLLAYLYAMTSCHRPDPLTGQTGAQAALCLLQSAGCRSIMEFKALGDEYDLWTSTKYPQINTAYQEILDRYYWPADVSGSIREDSVPDKHAERRAAHLFPSNAFGPISPGDYDDSKYLATRIPAEPRLAIPHSIPSLNECLPRPVTLDHLLCNCPAPELSARSTLLRNSHKTFKLSDDTFLLDQLFSSLRVDSSFHREYLARLDTSAQSVHLVSQMTHKVAGENLIEALQKHYVQCRANYLDSLDILKKSLGPTTDLHEQSIDRFGQWPPITADVLLRYLASTSPIGIPPCWKKCLISLALLLLELQRSRRLLRLALDGLEDEFSKELENEGCDGWHAEEYPDWLLIQVGFFCLNACLH